MARCPPSIAALLLLTVTLSGSNADAQNPEGISNTGTASSTTQGATNDALEAQIRINDAVEIIARMKSDPKVNGLLQDAKGLLIVPHFIKAAFIFGGRGGSGLLVVRKGDRWSDPAFYKTSGGTVGAQIGGAKGPLVMLLMSDKAVEAFENKSSTWSLTAGAGLTAANYSKEAKESGTISDVVVWSDAKGLFGGAAVGATNIAGDQKKNQAYYNRPDVTIQQIVSGAVTNQNSNILRDALPKK
jgi:lipid-binding SYLF domain-containing protein